MADLDKAVEISELYFTDIISTASLRQIYQEIIVSNSSSLFSSLSYNQELTNKIKEALTIKTVDEEVLYKGLFLQSVAVFEDFIKNIVEFITVKHHSNTSTYNGLDVNLQAYYLSSSGKALGYYSSGTVNGVKFDFKNLKDSLLTCLSGTENFFLDPAVFTVLMGNCTSDRLISLFSKLSNIDNIFTILGSDNELKKSLGESRKGQTSTLAKENLDLIIDLRNDIAHGSLTRTLSKDDFINHTNFLQALVKSLARSLH